MRTFALLAALSLLATSMASDYYTNQGCTNIYINGSPYSQLSLPPHWTVTTSGGTTTFSHAPTLARGRFQTSATTIDKGFAANKYRWFYTGPTAPSSYVSYAAVAVTRTAFATVNVLSSGASALSISFNRLQYAGPLVQNTVGQNYTPYYEDTRVEYPKFGFWSYAGGDDYYCDLFILSDMMGHILESNPVGMAPVSASSAGSNSFTTTPLSLHTGLSPSYINGATDTFVTKLFLDVETDSDVPYEKFAIDVVSGDYEMPMDAFVNGDYNFYYWAQGSLRKKLEIEFASLTIDDADVDLIWGDLNGDNYISTAEVNFVYSSVGAEEADGASWSLDYDGDGLVPQMADLDGDGEVTMSDYALVAGNSNTYGD